MLMNSLGQVVAQQNFDAIRGVNTVELSTGFRGAAFLVIRQGSQKFMHKVNLK